MANARVLEAVTGTYGSFARGLIALYQGEPQTAVTELAAATGNVTEQALFQNVLGRAHLLMDQFDRAQEHMAAAFGLQPWLACVRSNLAWLAFNRREHTLVLDLVDVDTDDEAHARRYEVGARGYLAYLDSLRLDVFMADGATDRAYRAVKARAVQAKHDRLLLLRALACFAAQDYQAGERELSESLAIDFRVVIGLSPSSVQLLRSARDARPESRAIQFAVAMIMAGETRLEEARAQLEQMAARWPSDEQVAYHLGALAELAGDRTAAIREFRRSISLRFPQTVTDRIESVAQALDEASSQQTELLRSIADGKLHLAVPFMLSLERHDLARTLAECGHEVDPQDPAYAVCLLGSGTQDEAAVAAAAQWLVDCVPLAFEAQRFLGGLLLSRGSNAEAAELFEGLLGDGSIDMTDVLRFGIARLSAGPRRDLSFAPTSSPPQ